MSNITSAGNLSVSAALTVGTNTILGTSSTNTLICNATPTLNNGLTVSGNITQSSGSISSGSGGITSNGDLVISSSKKLTTGTGVTTINGQVQANDIIQILSNKSLYISDSLLTNYLRMHHTGTAAYIDYTGGLTFRNSGTTTSLLLNNSNNQGTFYYNLNTNGITNTGNISSTGSISCSSLSNSGSYNAITCTSLINSGSSTLASVSCSSLNNSGSSTLASLSCSSLNNSGSSTLTGLVNTSGGIQNGNCMYMKADGTKSIYYTLDGTSTITNNVVGRLFGTTVQMYFDYLNNFLFRDTDSSNTASSNVLNINLTKSTFYSALQTNGALTINSSTASTTSGTGALICSGGAGIAGNVNVGGIITSVGEVDCNGFVNIGGNTLGPVGTTNYTSIRFRTYNNNSNSDAMINVVGGSSSTVNAGTFNILATTTALSNDLNVGGNIRSNYVNNIKFYHIRGYTNKVSGSQVHNWLLSSNQTTYTTNGITLPVDTGCFSIKILYTYYTTGSGFYQGATPMYIILYGNGTWIVNGQTATNTQGAFQFQPTITCAGGYLTIVQALAVNNGDYVYYTLTIEML